MLGGDPPFPGGTAAAILARHMHEPPPSLRVVRPTVPIAVQETIERALAKVPADRYSTVMGFSRALDSASRRRWWTPRRVAAGTWAVGESGEAGVAGSVPSMPVYIEDDQLAAGLPHILDAPPDLGTVELVVRRPAEGVREQLVTEAAPEDGDARLGRLPEPRSRADHPRRALLHRPRRPGGDDGREAARVRRQQRAPAEAPKHSAGQDAA